MSRTIRRKGQFEYQIGTYEEFNQDYSYWMWRYPSLNIQQIYVRVKANFHRDHKPGIYGVPRWYRNLVTSRPIRRRERKLLRVGIRKDEWDDHIPDSRTRGDRRYFW